MMGSDGDDLISLPGPPPPRPAARRAAIDAALRKFDGIESQPVPRKRRSLVQWAGTHRGLAGGLVTAALVAVVSIPAIQVALRDHPAGVASEERQRGPAQPKELAQPKEKAGGSNNALAEPQAPTAQTAASVPSPVGVQTETPIITENNGYIAGSPVTPPQMQPEAPIVADTDTVTTVSNSEEITTKDISGERKVSAGYIGTRDRQPPAPSSPSPAGASDRDGVAVGSRINDNFSTRKKSAAQPSAKVQRELEVSGSSDRTGEFLARLQSAFRANDRRAIIGLVGFPLRVNYAGGARTYRSRQEAERDYDSIFTAAVREAALNLGAHDLVTRDGGRLRGSGRIGFGCGLRQCSSEETMRIREITP